MVNDKWLMVNDKCPETILKRVQDDCVQGINEK